MFRRRQKTAEMKLSEIHIGKLPEEEGLQYPYSLNLPPPAIFALVRAPRTPLTFRAEPIVLRPDLVVRMSYE